MSKNDENEGTRIDCGDDLIDKTAANAVPARAQAPERGLDHAPVPQDGPEDLEDRLHSAAILMSEGIFEDAKKILRGILIADPHHVGAREKLDEIHGLELRQIFGEERAPRTSRDRQNEGRRVDSQAVMRQLDRDLKLGVFEDGDAGESIGTAMSLFRDAAAMKAFEGRVESVMATTAHRDRLDLGVAFLEMGLYDLAARQFRTAAQNPELQLSATSLLAYALIMTNRPFEAIMCIEPVIGDSEVAREDKIEFMYLMGRANEGLRKPETALQWYSHIRETDPGYRDVVERTRVLSEGLQASR